MLVGGFYALGEWWLRNRDADVSELISIMLSVMWLGLGRMQKGERSGTLPPASGSGVANAEHDGHGSLTRPAQSG